MPSKNSISLYVDILFYLSWQYIIGCVSQLSHTYKFGSGLLLELKIKKRMSGYNCDYDLMHAINHKYIYIYINNNNNNNINYYNWIIWNRKLWNDNEGGQE